MKKVCIVGCGGIARVHARHLRGQVELSFASRRRESAAALAAKFGGQVWDSYDQVLEGAVDGVVICTPPHLHAPQAVAALRAGKGVLVEKPMCADEEGVRAIGAAVAAHPQTPFMVAENYYYKPSLKLIKWIVARDFIGAVQHLHVEKCFSQEATGWKSRCGALLEGGIHFVALLSDIADAAPVRLQAEFPGHAGGPERHSRLRLEYAGGLRAELHYAWNVFSPTRGLFQHSRICGDAGRLTFESNGLYLRLQGRRRRLYFPGFGDLMGYAAMMRDFVRALRGEGEPYSNFARARRDLDIVFRAYSTLERQP